MKTLNIGLVTLVVLALVLSGCGAPAATATAPAATKQPSVSSPEPTQPPTEPAAKPKAITVGRGANDPKSIDPQRAVDARDSELTSHFFPGLLIPDVQTNELKPGIAKSWEVSDDGKVFTFHLIPQVPWVRYNPDNGAVEEVKDDSGKVRYVTAQDFVFGFTRALDPATASPAAYILAPYVVGGAEFNAGTGAADALGLKAVDDYTFEVTAPEKLGYTLGIYSIINAKATPEWAIKESGDAWTEPENINTYGPYALKAWEHENSLVMIKNPSWPGSEGIRQPKIDQVTLRFIDAATSLTEFEAGNMDYSPVPSDQIARLKADPKLGPELNIVPGMCTQAWGFNTKKPPFDNVHIRRAFNYAVDRVTLVNDVLAGGQIPAVFFTPPAVAVAPSALPEYKDIGTTFYDPEKAKAELAEGLKDLGLSSADQLPSITVEYGTSNELTAVAQALQAMWQETLGAQVTLSQIDVKVYWGKQEKDAGQIFRAGWCPDYNDANNYLLDVYRSDSIYNYGKWQNEEYDGLVDGARVETDVAARLDAYTKAEKILNIDDAGTMTLYYPVVATITKSNISRTYSMIGTDYFWDWDISQE
ncbi:MAG TPA: peptide ABC transporter substrate-binding protein [Anaerolineales bacterium]|nr:peptide ABC transporter substrate-binding protein [Anaerolineales bacterium]